MPLPALRAQAPTPASAVNQLSDFWRKEQPRRVLLTVMPEQNGETNPEDKTPTPQDMTQWLQKNHLIARSFGGATALAASMTAVPNANLGEPDFFASGDHYQDQRNCIMALLASLSEAQWHELASAQGLAWGSLNSDQKALWETMIPNPCVIQQSWRAQPGQTAPPEKSRTLSPAERHEIRVRGKLMGIAYGKTVANSHRISVLSRKSRNERYMSGEPWLNVRMEDPEENSNDSEATMYGQAISHKEPNRPQVLPAELEVLLTSEPVPVSESSDKPTTAGDLLAGIEAATGLKLYAGRAFRAMAIVVVNRGNIGAGSLLRALLFATGYTVRVLPPAKAGELPLFVLATQSEPVGRSFGRWNDWNRAADKTEMDMTEAANAQIAKMNPLSLLQFDTDDTFPLPTALREKVFKVARAVRDNPDSANSLAVQVPFNTLPSSAQTAINARARRLAEISVEGTDLRVRTDIVEVSCQAYLDYVIPGSDEFSGEVPLTTLYGVPDWLPETESSESMTVRGRTMILSADTPDEIRELVTAAHAFGAKAIWVQGTREIITAAVQVAEEIPVYAVVSLLRNDADLLANLPHDENVYGKSSREWLLPDDPEVIKAVAERVRKAGAIPGIAGVVLRDAVPPGYRGENEAKEDDQLSTGEDSYRSSTQALGYTLAHRRAFVQEAGVDPADLGGFEEDGPNNPVPLWHAWARKQLAPLWKAVRDAVGDKPIRIEGEVITTRTDRPAPWRMEIFTPWEAAQKEPPFAALFRESGQRIPSLSEKIDTLTVIVGNPGGEVSPEKILQLLKREDKPELTIWDLSNRNTLGVRERLRTLLHSAKEP